MYDTDYLSSVLSNTEWKIEELPFSHIVAFNVFREDFYNRLCIDFNLNMSNAYGRSMQSEQLSAKTRFFSLGLSETPLDTLAVFTSNEWLTLISSFFDIPVTKYINIGLHFHMVNSPTGWIHNDFNPGWFIKNKKDEENSMVSLKCNYKNGATSEAGLESIELVRAIAVIFYLNNENDMKGGGTGLYKHSFSDINCPDKIIEPKKNSILVFPCTPFSFHTFLSNRTFSRSSIIMWLHCTKEYAIEKWGEGCIVNWE